LLAFVEPDMWVVANFKETQLARMKPGQPVELFFDAVPGHTFHGTVDSLAPASGAQFALLPADNATGNFTKIVQRVPVKIVLDAEAVRTLGERLRPGLSTVVDVKVR
jgi:membrane fusion protein (multidrug efflux system)